MPFVDLRRNFRELKQAEDDDPEMLLALADSYLVEQVGWDQVLQHARVLLLAEAGSGKTAEMREQAERLRSQGHAAFFIRIEELAHEDLDDLLLSGDTAALDAWRANDGATAWLFLDAVDELKLGHGSLERALRRVAKAVDGLAHRVRVVISCRPTDWRPAVDLATFRRHLPVVPAVTGPVPDPEDVFLQALRDDLRTTQRNTDDDVPVVDDVRPMMLLPLSPSQIEVFARTLGVTDPLAFLAEIKKQNAWDFARRPLDLDQLIAIWKSRGRLGTLLEQHEASVAGRLQDVPDRPDRGALSDARLRLGAERLALALALTRTRSIRAPETAVGVEHGAGVLDAAHILTDWSEGERQTLLRRGLFDPATYGRVRFHHRTVQEYLAACRLRTLRERGMSTRALLGLLFANCYGVDVVIPSMRPVTVWVALWDMHVRRELMAREPEALFSLGDPESLPISAREELLRKFALAYGQGGWRGLHIASDHVRRLAHPELSQAVRETWTAAASNDDVRELLLYLIEQGPIVDCADLALEAARDVSFSEHHRALAVLALLASERRGDVRALVDSILADPPSWSDGVVGALVEHLFPGLLSVSELVVLAERPTAENAQHQFAESLRRLCSRVDPASPEAVELMTRIADLVWRGRDDQGDGYDTDGRFNHFVPALATLCSRQFVDDSATWPPNLVTASVIAAKFGGDDPRTKEALDVVRERASGVPIFREAAFWEQVSLSERSYPAEAQPPAPFQRLQRARYHGIIQHLEEGDRPWLEAALRDTTTGVSRRVVAMEALLRLWAQRGRFDAELVELREVADTGELVDLIAAWAVPARPEDPRIQEMDHEHARWQAEESERRARQLADWQRWRAELISDFERAFAPERRQRTIQNLHRWLRARQKTSHHFNVWDRAALSEAFGDDIAIRADSAFRAYWRTETPLLWTVREQGDRNTVLGTWAIGLTGLGAEAAESGWTTRLTEGEARIAAAYAPIELNGFPSWLKELVGTRPGAVDAVLGVELTTEFTMVADQQHLPVLHNTAYGAIELQKLLVPRAVAALATWPSTFATPEASGLATQHLEDALRIIGEAGDAQADAAAAAECGRRIAIDSRGPLAKAWLRGLFAFDPNQGVATLETLLDAVPAAERPQVAVETFAVLFGDRQGVALREIALAQRVDTLVALIRLAYTYVRPEDDQRHEGAYTRNFRDDAQWARGFLLGTLLETPGAEAQRALLELADGILAGDSPDRVRHLARERAARDADTRVLGAADVLALEQRYEAPPIDRDGLFGVNDGQAG